MIRDDIKAALVSAMKGGDKASTGTLRLVQAAIKNRDIEVRGSRAEAEGRAQSYTRDGDLIPAKQFKEPDDDQLVTEVLQKMIKQRRESADLYRRGGRAELAEAEDAEIAVIERFLPRQMTDDEARAAVQAIIADTGATSMKDMGRVMAEVKARHGGAMEPARASALVREMLG